MKKYHLADVCTALECVCAFTILGMVFYRADPEAALCAFFVGQIFDAVDGPLARRFHYPDDGKSRWWRTYAGLIDQLSDLLIGVIGCVYIAACVDRFTGLFILIGSLIIGLTIQTLAYNFPPLYLNWLKTAPALGTKIVLIRRWFYVAILAFMVAFLLWNTTWPTAAKTTVTVIFCAIGLFLFVCKLNRLTEVKTECKKKPQAQSQKPQA